MVEGARLESVYTGNRIVSSNLIPSAISFVLQSFGGFNASRDGLRGGGVAMKAVRLPLRKWIFICLAASVLCGFFYGVSATAQDDAGPHGLRQKWAEAIAKRRSDNAARVLIDIPMSSEGFHVRGAGKSVTQALGDRSFILYTPPATKPAGAIPLLVVLHGGGGSASQIQGYLGIEPYADRAGFIVVYLNGTKVMRGASTERAGWNGGECCGLPQSRNIDDVGFIRQVIDYMVEHYGVDRGQVYGTGHSNGAIMTYRVLCETDIYKAAVPYSGALELAVESCPYVRGKRILAIHGARDDNLPVKGGHTISGFNQKTNYRSQEYTKSVMLKSGADYQQLILADAAHKPETINRALLETEHMTLPQKIVTFLGLDK